jgi:type I restriction enzyme R subunit
MNPSRNFRRMSMSPANTLHQIENSPRSVATSTINSRTSGITTLQKFPFVSRQLLKLAEERGEQGTGSLPTRRCAVIIDEAHSSQGGETATDLKEVLGGEDLREEARKQGGGRSIELRF